MSIVLVLTTVLLDLLGNAEADINLGEYFETRFSQVPKITTSPLSICDDSEQIDLCFWTNMTFQVKKGHGNRIGTIGPPHDPGKCGIKNISYNILTGLEIVKLYPPDDKFKFWTIGIKESENNNPKGVVMFANITCLLSTSENLVRYSKLVEIKIQETRCNVPEPQDRNKIYTLPSSKIKKGDTVDNLLFLDPVSLGENKYETFIDNRTISEFLSSSCTYHPDTRLGKNRTAIHCRLTATRPKTIKNDLHFLLGLRNINIVCARKNNTGFIKVTFKVGHNRIRRSNVFNNNSKIFRTAAPYARVTQAYTNNVASYECKATNAKINPLGITREGIIYVNNTRALKDSPEYLRINITWIKNNVTQYEELSIRVVEEPVKTCTTLNTEDAWTVCSSFKSAKSCVKKDSCGLGTGGMTSVGTRSEPQRCMWRGDKNPENHETHLYSTCSSDTRYCPDGICDSLEMLAEDDLCPQDCTNRAVFPTRLNEKTGRGVDKCNGVLVCELGCSCLLKRTYNATNNSNSKEGLVGAQNAEKIICDMECMLLASGAVGTVVFFLFLSVILWRVIRMKKLTNGKYTEHLPETETPFSDYIDRNAVHEPMVLNFDMTTSLDNPSLNTLKSIKVDIKWKFPRQQIFIEQVLGEGEFGKVLKAKAFNIAGRPGYSLVAVKTLKDDARNQDYNDLFSEYQLLKEVNHPHVIQLLGVCSSEDGPLYVIIEYAVFGSLRNYLRRSRHILTTVELGHIEDNLNHMVTSKNILSFARQIASGMSYLSDVKLVHRDLAARNILLAENKVCKISDFGLTRDIYEDNAYFKKSKGRVPVKWMAPESLADHIYTTKSDVWSFGVLIWELITLGASPYPGIPVHNLYNLLKQGYRMERPPNCSTVLYSFMTKCWNIDPNERPAFLDLYHCFDNILTDNVNYLDLSDNAIINKSYFSNFSADADSGTSDLLGEKINFLKNNLYKDHVDGEGKLPDAIKDFRGSCPGYETPVKAPRPVLTPTNEAPGEYTDMNMKQ